MSDDHWRDCEQCRSVRVTSVEIAEPPAILFWMVSHHLRHERRVPLRSLAVDADDGLLRVDGGRFEFAPEIEQLRAMAHATWEGPPPPLETPQPHAVSHEEPREKAVRPWRANGNIAEKGDQHTDDRRIVDLITRFLPLSPTVRANIYSHWDRRRLHRIDALLAAAGSVSSRSSPAAALYLLDHAEDRPILDATAIVLRAAYDAEDPLVVPALGRLLGRYLDGPRAPDELFRGLVRLLVECSGPEFHALLLTCYGVAMTWQAGDEVGRYGLVVARGELYSIRLAADVVLPRLSDGEAFPPRWWLRLPVTRPLVQRVYDLIAAHLPRSPAPANDAPPFSGPILDGPTALRCLEILRPTPDWPR